jgi:hypothetical protein
MLQAYMTVNPPPPYITFALNGIEDQPSDPGRNTILSLFLCPSDPNSPKNRTVPGNEQGFHSNYVTCAGSGIAINATRTQAVDADYEILGHPSVSLDDIRHFRQLSSRAPPAWSSSARA